MNAIIGSNIIELGIIGSTNNYATGELLTKRPPEGTVYVANRQESGRGQLNNKWESETGKNLTISIVLYPEPIEIINQFEISKMFALGISDFLGKYIDDVKIKWPNDIYVGNGKIAGLLIESSISQSKISSCIGGMGININQQKFVSDAPNPVSLCQVTGRFYDLDTCLKFLCEMLDIRYKQLLSGDTANIDKDYISKLFRYNELSGFKDDEGVYKGQIEGVDNIGRLIISDTKGRKKSYHYKEVEFLP